MTDDQLASLEVAISKAEVTSAIKSLALGKAPRPDRYAGEFCKALCDAENVFDNVQWDWLGLVLDRIGITRSFELLGGLYCHPTAQVCTPGFLSPLSNYTRVPDKNAHYPHCFSILHSNPWPAAWRIPTFMMVLG